MPILRKTILAPLLSALWIFSASEAPAFELEITRNATELDLQWESRPGMLYRLISSPDLEAPIGSWEVVMEDLEGTAPLGSISTPLPNTETLFYRMEEYLEPLVRVEMVAVGDPGNPADSGLTGFGAVSYEYEIGKYEVTNQEYTTFLNAVDPLGANSVGLYRSNMTTSSNGGINFRIQNFDGAKYEVKPGFASKPVNYISFYDAMRFCNWLHNGAQAGGDTENGAYTLVGGGIVPTNGVTVLRNAGAKFTVPTNDEWYKAAYYQPANDGGDLDSYWRYPTRSNEEPDVVPPPGGASAANYDDAVGIPTNVGAYTQSGSYYGTFDMAGNLEEWLETHAGVSNTLRGRRGTSWLGSRPASTDSTAASPTSELHLNGFRIVSP